MSSTTVLTHKPIALQDVFQGWWPLAASWLLMGFELPAVSAVIARMPDPEINLAAYGGVVFALALIIEAPIIMMLAASTALSKDRDSYNKLRLFMMVLGGMLTVLHIAIAFTPLFNFVVEDLIGAPEEIIEPSRIGLQIMVPWTWFIAYRRFNQGVLIRFGRSRAVGFGTFIRLVINVIFLFSGFHLQIVPGIVVGTIAVIAGVIVEAIYVHLRVRPILDHQFEEDSDQYPTLTLRDILAFYIPLAMTSLIFLLVQPIGSATLSRMPDPIQSLAVWPVISGLTFMVRSLGVAYNEIVVALLGKPGSLPSLRRFTIWLSVFTSGLLLLIAATPLSGIWFASISGLSQELAALAQTAIWIPFLWPAFNVYQSWYQGTLVFTGRTRAITEAVIIFLLSSSLILWGGVIWGEIPGIFIGLIAYVVGSGLQTLWLRHRSRFAFQQLTLQLNE